MKLLSEVSIFSQLDKETLMALSKKLRKISLDGGGMLFKKGDESKSMYLIANGKVKIHDGDYVFAELIAGEIFGEYAILDSGVRSASVSAVQQTDLLELTRVDFEDILANKPRVKDDILKMLLLRLRAKNDWEEQLASKNRQIIQQKEEIEKQRDEIQAQKDLKDRFFSIISHDLRGPVSSFQGITSIIRMYIRKQKYDQLEGMMDDIDHAATNLSRLLDNLLNWASQEQKQIPYHPSELELVELLRELFDSFHSTARSKEISLVTGNVEGIFLWADKNTIVTVLRNLIHNALKFTNPGGSIQVDGSSANGLTEIQVRDTGQGIPKEKLQNLFGDMKSTYGTGGEKGVGLGLQLVREFVDLNKGEIKVTSKVGEGTTFTIRLPARPIN